jgi:hypothetical protein
MEFASDYSTLEKTDPDIYKEMAMVLLLELALKTGYTHGDFHSGNIMINKTAKGYFGPIEGKPLLIDFGLTAKIPPRTQSAIEELCDNEQYTEALNMLCTVSRKDGTPITRYPAYYGWACGSVPVSGDVNVEIADMIKKRELSSKSLSNFLKYKRDLSNPLFYEVKFYNFSKNDPEYETIKKNVLLDNTGLAHNPEALENTIKDVYLKRERDNTANTIKMIKESFESSVLNDIADVQNLRFPQDTNIHIKSLFEQRRIMQQTFKERRRGTTY